MKKRVYFFSFLLIIIVLFIVSPYIIGFWQHKNVLEAAGGMPIFEGALGSTLTQCQACDPPACCEGGSLCSMSAPSACPNYDMQVTKSAGGQTCPTGYLLTIPQYGIVNGSQNVIIGGTTCTSLSIVASEKGCLGCTARINSPKVYAYKNKMKAVIDFIIAGFKDN